MAILTGHKTGTRNSACGAVAGAIALTITGLIYPAFAYPVRASNVAKTHRELAVSSQKNLHSPDQEATAETDASTFTEPSELSERTFIPGTSVSLRPPADFILSQQFSGFINEETLSSIVLTELPLEAYSEIEEALSSTPEEVTNLFSSRGVTLEVDSISSILVRGEQVPFVKGIQTFAGSRVQKYFVLLGEESTVLLTFNVIDDAIDGSQLSEQTVVEAIQSVEIGSVPSIEQKVAELPFTFVAADPFEVLDVLLGSTVVLSLGGESDASGETPFIAIATSLNPVYTSDIAEYSLQLMNSTEGFSDAVVTEQQPIEFADGNGYFVSAESSDDTIFQYLTIQPDNAYIRMIVLGSREELEQLLPAIQTIRSSVTVKEPVEGRLYRAYLRS